LGEKDPSYAGIFDICIESLSHSKPSEEFRDTVTKKEEYARAGVKEYYLLDASGQQTACYRLTANQTYEPIPPRQGDIIVSKVLPGWQFRLRDLERQPTLEQLSEDPVYQHFVGLTWQAEKQARQVAEAQAQAEKQARQAEQEARQLAEAHAQAEQEARQLAEAHAQAEQEARQLAEALVQAEKQARQAEQEARRLAEALAQAEKEARQLVETQAQMEREAHQLAEAKLQQLQAELDKFRVSSAKRKRSKRSSD
jgi:hypothetical protein